MRIERKVVCGQEVDVEVYEYEVPEHPDPIMNSGNPRRGHQGDTWDADATYPSAPTFHLHTFSNYFRSRD